MTQNELIIAIAVGMILNNLAGLVISEIREKIYQAQSKKRLAKLFDRYSNEWLSSEETPVPRPSAAKKAAKRTPKKDTTK